MTPTIAFTGFYPGASPTNNEIVRLLGPGRVVIPPGPDGHFDPIPQFLFFSVFSERSVHLDPRYDSCIKIHTTSENFRPPWEECDYAMTGDYSDDPRHLRLPPYLTDMVSVGERAGYARLGRPCPTLVKDPDNEVVIKPKFCCFLYSNETWRDPRAAGPCGLELRKDFCRLLSRYKRVDCGGKVLNNLGYQVSEKLPHLAEYKFTIAFENASHPGYVSEKLVDPMFVGSLPIYWGSPRIADDFRPESLVVATGCKLEDVVSQVVALDRDDEAYRAKMREPWFKDNVPNRYCQPDYVPSFLHRVFEAPKRTRKVR